MSTRSDATTDQVTYSGAIPSTAGGFSLTAWARVHVDRNDYSTIARISSGGSTRLTFATKLDGLGGPSAYTPSGGSVEGTLGWSAVDVWRKVAVTCDADDAIVYCRDPGGSTTVVTSGAIAGQGTGDLLALFGRGAGDTSEWFSGDLAHVRLWFGVRLTQAQAEAEWDSASPIVASPWAVYPLLTAGDLTDHSGNGRHLTAGSTGLTTVDDPPISSTITGNGSVTAANATLAGTGTTPVLGTGSVSAGNADVLGSGSTPIAGSGGVTSSNAAVSGTGDVPISANGTVSATTDQVSGTGSVSITGNGSVVTSQAVVDGTGSSLPVIGGSGSLVATASVVAGLGTILITGNGNVIAPSAIVSGRESNHEIPSAKRSKTTVLANSPIVAVRENRATTTVGD